MGSSVTPETKVVTPGQEIAEIAFSLKIINKDVLARIIDLYLKEHMHEQ